MRTRTIVIEPPGFNDLPRFGQTVEQVSVKAFIAPSGSRPLSANASFAVECFRHVAKMTRGRHRQMNSWRVLPDPLSSLPAVIWRSLKRCVIDVSEGQLNVLWRLWPC